MKKLLGAILLVALAIGGWYFASPYYAIYRLTEASRERDFAQLEQRVDYAALRRSAASEAVATVRERFQEGELLEDLRGAASDILQQAANGEDVTRQDVVDAVVMDRLVEGLTPEGLQLSPDGFDIARQGLDNFRATSTYEDGSPGPVLIFTREGLGWILTGIELPRL